MGHHATLLTEVRGQDEMSDRGVDWEGSQGQIWERQALKVRHGATRKET